MQNKSTYSFHEQALRTKPSSFLLQQKDTGEGLPAACVLDRIGNVSACDFETFCVIISLLSCYRSANSKQVLPLPSLNRNFPLSFVCIEKSISCEALFCASGELIFSSQNCYGIAEVEWSKGNIYDSLCEGSSGNAPINDNLNQQYRYNVRSWLTGIDNVHTSEFIYYNHKIDGIRSGSSITYGDFIPCWNGNIAATNYLSSNDNIIGFNYTYDGLNRLTSAEDTKNPPLGSLRNVKNYSSSYIYDLNGNITSLTRNDGLLSNSFEYGYSGNQLSSTVNNSQDEAEEEVEDIFDGGKINSDNLQKLSLSSQKVVSAGKANPGTIVQQFAYDLNGNFKSDNTKGTTYTYNVFNMPLQISVNNSEVIGTIKYKYDAQGNKLRADYSWLNATSIDKVKDGGVGKVTKPKNSIQYIEYAGNKRYKGKVLDMIHIDGGYIKGGEYYFYEKDHLGNNIAVIDTNGNLVQQTFYHPYGKPIDDLSTAATAQPHKYGGKEEETMLGLAMFDFHARQYYGNSPHLPPVFGGIDPLAHKYYSFSPYMYCMGNPLKFVDLDGRWSGNVHHAMIRQAVMELKGSGDLHMSNYEIKRMIKGMIKGSDRTDGLFNGNQKVINSHKHFMRDPSIPSQTAKDNIQKHVNDNVENFKQTGNYESLGSAVHTMEDATCPSHATRNADGSYEPVTNDMGLNPSKWTKHMSEDDFDGASTKNLREGVENTKNIIISSGAAGNIPTTVIVPNTRGYGMVREKVKTPAEGGNSSGGDTGDSGGNEGS